MSCVCLLVPLVIVWLYSVSDVALSVCVFVCVSAIFLLVLNKEELIFFFNLRGRVSLT